MSNAIVVKAIKEIRKAFFRTFEPKPLGLLKIIFHEQVQLKIKFSNVATSSQSTGLFKNAPEFAQKAKRFAFGNGAGVESPPGASSRRALPIKLWRSKTA
ncbi:MAG: hypothetical protein ACLFU4_06240 [Opitutales bacterium]